jgi:energy-coupling factor transporter ATP-binding protein EcfA2
MQAVFAPSRLDNPFATCWTKPGALPFRFPPGESAQRLLAKLAAQNWRGAIIGPHGSGKSTLLESLKPQLADAGRRALSVALRDRQRQLTREFVDAVRSFRPNENHLLVIDGYEQLGWRHRLFLAHVARRKNVGLLVTAHRRIGIPKLIQLAPNTSLVAQLIADLSGKVSTSVSPEEVAASHACHGSNVREIFFDLYDRHERKRRSLRTGAP